MRVEAVVEGNLKEIVRGQMRAAKKAAAVGIRKAAKGLHKEVKAHVRGAGFKGLARPWRAKHFRKGRTAFDVASLVYVRADEGVRHAVWALEHGDTMRAKNGRFLVIPTGFNKPKGQRKSKERYLISPAEMVAMKKWTYTKKTSDGQGLVWFLRVTEAAKKTRSGRVQRLAFAGGMALGGRNRGDVGSGRGRRVGKILKEGAVPMFILLPQVRVQKQLNIQRIADRWQPRAVDYVLQEWERLDGAN